MWFLPKAEIEISRILSKCGEKYVFVDKNNYITFIDEGKKYLLESMGVNFPKNLLGQTIAVLAQLAENNSVIQHGLLNTVFEKFDFCNSYECQYIHDEYNGKIRLECYGIIYTLRPFVRENCHGK
jgi:hypothetical protein